MKRQKRHIAVKRGILAKWLVAVVILLPAAQVNAQKLLAVADRNKILIGEQAELVVKLEEFNTRTSNLQNWISPGDSSGHIQVVKTEPIDTVELNGYTTYIQKITLTSFDSGKWKLPPLSIVLSDKASGKETVLTTDSIALEVLPVDVAGLQSYHDIKDLQPVEVKPDYTLYIAVALSAIALVVLAWLLLKKRKKQPVAAVTGYKESSLAAAIKKLNQLDEQKLCEKGETKLFYTQVAAVCREYFFDQLQVQSPQLTSVELMIKLTPYVPMQKQRTALFQLLRLTDLVKFAKYMPTAEENKSTIPVATDCLRYVDSNVPQVKANINFQLQQHHKQVH